MNLLPDAVEFVKVIKKTSVEAVEATKPVNVFFGKVVSVSPLEINVEQKLTLGRLQLIVAERLITEQLKKNDEVILIRQQGGQKYVVIDRIGVI